MVLKFGIDDAAMGDTPLSSSPPEDKNKLEFEISRKAMGDTLFELREDSIKSGNNSDLLGISEDSHPKQSSPPEDKNKLKFGIDDAGRGPVIGPMIVAGCIIYEEHEEELRLAGVKDSKLLSHKKRIELEEKIKELAHSFSVRVADPDMITETNNAGLLLNELEASMAADIINEINIIENELHTVLDCPSPNLNGWGNFLKSKITKLDNLIISCEHKADFNHISVGCASILAKCERERQMDLLREKFGDEIGSGYPSDPKTKKFLEKYAREHSDKGIFRKNWETYKRYVPKDNQQKLF